MLNPSAVGRISVPPPASGRRRPFAPSPRDVAAELDAAAAAVDPFNLAAWLAAGLRGVMGIAQDTCRLRPVSPLVQAVEHRCGDAARLAIHGVHTCKSPLCPLCAPKWQRTRSDEITRAIDRWKLGPDGVFFVTLTMRHNRSMPLSLQHRLLTAAFGSLWGGNLGQKAARRLGGKPETIRAHDRTWSYQRGWHPHIHALLFTANAELGTDELARLLDVRWPKCLCAALRRMQSLVRRILSRSSGFEADGSPTGRGGCGRKDCRTCFVPFQGPRRELVFSGPLRDGEERRIVLDRALGAFPLPADEQQGECFHFRERATRLFGVRLVPRTRRVKDGCFLDGTPRYFQQPVPLAESIERLSKLLSNFTERRIQPSASQGAFVERMRDRERLPNYLAKLGLELGWTLGKAGKEDSGGVLHFGHSEVAGIACSRPRALAELAERVRTDGERLRDAARKAYGQLFWATIGTQTITFSDREALGLDADPYAEGGEPAEASGDETSTVIGQIEALAYRERAEQRGHGVLAELSAAYERGELSALPYVDPPAGGTGRELRRSPSSERGPPATADPEAVDRDGFVIERPERWTPGGALPLDARVTEVVDNGSAIGAAYRKASALPSSHSITPEQIRQRVREAIYGRKDVAD